MLVHSLGTLIKQTSKQQSMNVLRTFEVCVLFKYTKQKQKTQKIPIVVCSVITKLVVLFGSNTCTHVLYDNDSHLNYVS